MPSDFAGNAAAVDRLVDAAPDVYNHNTETVPRLFHVVRRQKVSGTFCAQHAEGRCDKRFLTPFFPDYAWTLEMFRRIRRRNPAIALKTGLMLGMGETSDELLDTLADLFEAGCRLLTLGQYFSRRWADAGGSIRATRGVRGSRRASPAYGLRSRGRRPVRAFELSCAGNGETKC